MLFTAPLPWFSYQHLVLQLNQLGSHVHGAVAALNSPVSWWGGKVGSKFLGMARAALESSLWCIILGGVFIGQLGMSFMALLLQPASGQRGA